MIGSSYSFELTTYLINYLNQFSNCQSNWGNRGNIAEGAQRVIGGKPNSNFMTVLPNTAGICWYYGAWREWAKRAIGGRPNSTFFNYNLANGGSPLLVDYKLRVVIWMAEYKLFLACRRSERVWRSSPAGFRAAAEAPAASAPRWSCKLRYVLTGDLN